MTLSGIGVSAAGELLKSNSHVALYFVELENFLAVRSLYGEQFTGQFLTVVAEEVQRVVDEEFSGCALRHVEPIDYGQFLILCGPEGCIEPSRLPDHAISLRVKLKTRLREEAHSRIGQSIDVLTGFSRVSGYGSHGAEAAMYNALCDAQRSARGRLDGNKLGMLDEFRRLLSENRLRTVYQPIVNLTSGEILAWEALTRGPEGSIFESPAALFDYAEDAGEIFALEKACRECAIRNFGKVDSNKKLFINIHPRTLADPAFHPGETMRMLRRYGLSPSQVVFEITERHAIRDFTTFHRTLEHYRGQGYKVAIDDVGTGYNGLWSIAELRPDYIKIDMSLTRGIDTNPVKRALLETFVAFAEKIGAKIISEGIETGTELSGLISMGTHYGQGFYLARPASPKPDLCLRRSSWSSPAARNGMQVKCSIPVRELAEKAFSTLPDTPVRQVKSVLKGDEPISAVVVAENGRPRGLVMSYHLDRALSSPYGMSLYYDREITRIMDPAPLIVEEEMTVEAAARRAMGREKAKLYDHIIVTHEGRLTGIVSVQNMLDSLAAVQVEMAKGANPLSGLPGNVAIEQEIERRFERGDPFTVIYADLDNFKVYNDVYGFKNGDNILLLLANIMSWAARRHGSENCFTGHIGGDDFVMICESGRAERLCLAITRCFKRLIGSHYSPEDREIGFVKGRDRTGVSREFPLVSVSLAVVDCRETCSLSDLARRSAEVKKCAKSVAGNSWFRDRRSCVKECKA